MDKPMNKSAVSELPLHVSAIKVREGETRYVKRGKKYIPVTDPYATYGLSAGWWLVGVRPGGTTIRQCVYPDKAAIEAAATDLEDKLVDIIREASQIRPIKTQLLPSEKLDWDALIQKHGNSFSSLQFPSFHENAERIVSAILGTPSQYEPKIKTKKR